VGYGATQEIGPFLVDTNDNGLKFNNFSWNKGMKHEIQDHKHIYILYAQLGDDFTGLNNLTAYFT